MQKDLIVEEFKEFIQAEHDMALMSIVSRAECLKELADLVYVAAQYAENMELRAKARGMVLLSTCKASV